MDGTHRLAIRPGTVRAPERADAKLRLFGVVPVLEVLGGDERGLRTLQEAGKRFVQPSSVPAAGTRPLCLGNAGDAPFVVHAGARRPANGYKPIAAGVLRESSAILRTKLESKLTARRSPGTLPASSKPVKGIGLCKAHAVSQSQMLVTCWPPIENPITQKAFLTLRAFVRTAYCARLSIGEIMRGRSIGGESHMLSS